MLVRLWREKEPLYLVVGRQNGINIVKNIKVTQKVKNKKKELSYALPILHLNYLLKII